MEKKEEIEPRDKAVLPDDNLVVYGRFSYGGYSKTYGLFFIVVDSEERKIIKLDLDLSSDAELKNIDLELDNQEFIEKIKLVTKEGRYDKHEFISDLKRSFSEEEIDELIKWGQLDLKAEIEGLIKEKLEDLIQEQIDLEARFKLEGEEELQKNYPELFPEQEKSEEDKDDIELEEAEGDDKLGLEISLNCSPIISPTRGKKANNLKVGDKLIVKVTDEREVGQYLSDLLQEKKGQVVGVIIEIDFNEESQRYLIRIKFGPNIYGKLVVEPEVKLTYLAKNEKLSKQETDSMAEITVDKNLLFLVAGVVIIMVILIVMLMISL
ncbi:hypothetical protein [Natroniella sp. ANB-PHB2]|uniref:hypothetical protein n=1 Tax=Natroniella sp. ANB-PHB2 TaxID=3384444 RepID=UPI0038D3F36E